jgi:hypothetical protein
VPVRGALIYQDGNVFFIYLFLYLYLQVRAIVAGPNNSAVIYQDGNVYVWGYNKSGALGLQDEEDKFTPQHLHTIHGLPIRMLGLGTAHVIALIYTENGFFLSLFLSLLARSTRPSHTRSLPPTQSLSLPLSNSPTHPPPPSPTHPLLTPSPSPLPPSLSLSLSLTHSFLSDPLSISPSLSLLSLSPLPLFLSVRQRDSKARPPKRLLAKKRPIQI